MKVAIYARYSSDSQRPERDRDNDPREVFTRGLNLPRGPEREIVRDRDREYTLRGSETRTLATVGAFRVVSSRDLRDRRDRPTAHGSITSTTSRSITRLATPTIAIAAACPYVPPPSGWYASTLR